MKIRGPDSSSRCPFLDPVLLTVCYLCQVGADATMSAYSKTAEVPDDTAQSIPRISLVPGCASIRFQPRTGELPRARRNQRECRHTECARSELHHGAAGQSVVSADLGEW